MAFLSASRLVLLRGLWLVPLCLTLASAQNTTSDSTCPPKDAFHWGSISPSKSIDWTPCYETMFCARLKVPLDYENPRGGVLAIALLKIPANISTSDPAYRGSILINPGGPGGSGIDAALSYGPAVQTIIGADFDIIGFDPRGVSRTTPGINAFRGASLQKQVWNIRNIDAPLVGDSDEALARTIALQSLSSRVLADNAASTAPYVGTAAVAHDMLSIVEALGQDKLQYWGVSYGSVLGMTFASLFPEKCGRVIVDGVLNLNAWYKGNYTENFREENSVISIVASQCAATVGCPLHEATAEAVQNRLFGIFDSLRTKVVTLYDGAKYMVYIDRKLALTALWSALYFPYEEVAPLFEALSDLEKGDGRKLYNIIGSGNVTCEDCHPSTVAHAGASPDADISIQCADSGPSSDDIAFLRGAYNTLTAETYLADPAFSLLVRCLGWSLESKSRFNGTAGGNTSFPLLFIGNIHDNITPLENALNMSPLFNGSAVLTRNAIGHTSLSGTSLCTSKVVRDYFRNGVLPSPGTICDDIAETVFGNNTTPTKRALGHGDLDEQILEAAKVISMAKSGHAFGLSM